MARRKGKSQHRKNWQQHYESGHEAKEQFSRRLRLTQRAIKLPADRQAGQMENVDDLPKVQGMVMGLYPGGAVILPVEAVSSLDSVESQSGKMPPGRELFCSVAKTFRAPPDATALAVGDEVTVALTKVHHADAAGADKLRTDGMILLRQPRRTALSRPQPRSGKHRDQYATEVFEKVIVANMDALLIVAATRQPALHHGLIDRFLIIAERGELTPIIVINKIDLGPLDAEMLDELSGLGAPLHQVSAVTGEGIDSLTAALAGRRSVLSGPSGVGKSTLVNALVPGALAVTQTVRLKDDRGRHTTAAAVIYGLPGGGTLVDTPGVRELGMNLKARELWWYFPEFDAVAKDCRFADCTHTHEPNCAVQKAAAEGRLPLRRYESYLRIFESLES